MPTNPSWTYEEVVLAADLSRQNGWRTVRVHDPRVLALSDLLRRSGLHGDEMASVEDFRSPGSIRAKCDNVRTMRSDYDGQATRGGPFDEPVALAFEEDEDEMSAVAALIRSALEEGERLVDDPLIDVEEASAHEGRLIPSMRLRRERDRGLRSRKLQAVQKAGQPIACEVCDFDFSVRYGSRGDGYIQVHHVTPLHLSGPTETKLSDLVLLCANCHVMAHNGRVLNPADLRAMLR